MEELDRIISLISKYTETSKNDILRSHTRKSSRARGFLCYMVYTTYPHLLIRLYVQTHMTSYGVATSAKSTEHKIMNDIDARVIINEIRRELGLSYVKKDALLNSMSDTRRLFGFDYTDSDVKERMEAIVSAKAYMDKLCSYGHHPLGGSMVSNIPKNTAVL